MQKEPRRQGIFRKSRKTVLQEPRSNGNLNNQLTIVNKQLNFHQRPTLRRHILYITSVGIFNRIFNRRGNIFRKQTADKYVNKYQLTFKQVCEKKSFVEDMRPLNFLTTLPIIKKITNNIMKKNLVFQIQILLKLSLVSKDKNHKFPKNKQTCMKENCLVFAHLKIRELLILKHYLNFLILSPSMLDCKIM